MKQRPRRYFTEPEILAMWERWHAGESLNSIARDLDRGHSAVQGALARSAPAAGAKKAVPMVVDAGGTRGDFTRCRRRPVDSLYCVWTWSGTVDG